MKAPWCLAASDPEATAAVLVNHYARRWTIEPAFRDTKDLRFGMGLSATRIGEPMRRDRLLLISAFATALLTLLGAVGESLGMDRLLKSNTSKTRTHSLFRQGCMLYDLIPNMPEHRLAPLMQNFADAVSKAGVFVRNLPARNEGMSEVDKGLRVRADFSPYLLQLGVCSQTLLDRQIRRCSLDDEEKIVLSVVQPSYTTAAPSACCARRGSSFGHYRATSSGWRRLASSTSTPFATRCSRRRHPRRIVRLSSRSATRPRIPTDCRRPTSICSRDCPTSRPSRSWPPKSSSPPACTERLHNLLPGLEVTKVPPPEAKLEAPVLLVPEQEPRAGSFLSRDREDELSDLVRRIRALHSQRRNERTMQARCPSWAWILASSSAGRCRMCISRGASSTSGGVPLQSSDALPLAAEPFAAALDLIFSAAPPASPRRRCSRCSDRRTSCFAPRTSS